MTDHTDFFPTTEETDSIGNVTIKDDELFIGREEQEINVYLQPRHRDNIKVGDYLRIPYRTPNIEGERLLFGVISRLQYRQRTQFDDQYDSDVSREIGEHNYAYIARIEPIAIVRDDGEREENGKDDLELDEKVIYKRKSVSVPPKPKAKVYTVEDKKVLQTGLDIPDDGDFAGFLAVAGEKVPDEEDALGYFFENPEGDASKEPQIFRHTLVSGSTGQGKTHFSKNLLRQYVDNKRFRETIPEDERKEQSGDSSKEENRLLNISIIDPENEYIEMKDDGSELTDKQKELCQKYGIKYGGLENSPNVKIQAWEPQIQGTVGQTKADKSFSIPFRIIEEYPHLLFHSNTQQGTKSRIREMVQTFFSNPSTDNTYEAFCQWADTYFDTQDDVNEFVERAVKKRVVDSSVFHKVFDNGGKPLDRCSNEMFERGQVTIFPMRHIVGREEELVVTILMQYIAQNQLETGIDDAYLNGTPMLLAIDEAHKYLNEPTTERERLLISQFRETARRGRKVNFGLYIVTQNPEDIDGEIRKQVNTKVYLGLDPTVVESPDVYVPTEFKNRVKEFDKGEAIIQAPGKRPVEVKGLPFCVVSHQ